MKLRTLPTTELTLHPASAHLPRLADDAPEFLNLLQHIAEHGAPPEPIKVNQYRVVAGVDAWEACLRLGVKSVDCLEIGPTEIFAHLAATLTTRAHYTKGQRAYLAYPLLAPLLDAARKRKVAVLKQGSKSGVSASNPRSALSALRENDPDQKGATTDPALAKFALAKTAEDLATALGIGRRLFFLAQTIHKHFAANPELRAKYEPRILEQDEDGSVCGLGGISAGIAGDLATKGITPLIQPELQLWGERIAKWFDPRKFSGWDKASPETRAAAAAKFADELAKTMPPEIIAAVEADAFKRAGLKPRLTVVRDAQASA